MEILLEAIHQGHVSIEKYGFLPGFRARICELRKYGVPFVPITISEINKYGRPYKLTRHSLPTEDQKKAAVRIYNRVNSELK